MLRLAGKGIAMATAPRSMREEADLVIDDLPAFLTEIAGRLTRQGVQA